MFLSKLDQEKKELFFQLSIHAARSNNIFADEQKAMINEYCVEMGFTNKELETTMALDEVLERIKETSDEQEIRVIVFEILGLLLSDKRYDDLEKAFVDNLKSTFNLSEEVITEMINLLNEFDRVFVRICDAVL